MDIRKGIAVVPGFAIGEAFLLDTDESTIPRRFITPEEIDGEIARYEQANAKAREDILALKERAAPEIGHEAAPIFDAHVQILSDDTLHREIISRIRDNRFSAEYAVSRSLRKFHKAYARIEDSYLAQRASDLRDLERQLLAALLGERKIEFLKLDRPVILVASELPASMAAGLDKNRVMGFATDMGGLTGHTAIVARAREIPAVMGLTSLSQDVNSGDQLVVDGHRGIVVINPDEATLATYRQLQRQYRQFETELSGERNLPAVTPDGCRVNVLANIETASAAAAAVEAGAEGVGLYRTEFLYVDTHGEPDEETQFAAYREALDALGGLPLTLRTLDLGSDKFFHTNDVVRERNPNLGCRAIRYCLTHQDLFRRQLRAICRVSALGPVKLMIPMVSSVEEVMETRRILTGVQDRLAEEGVAFDPFMPFGIMVELPSVAWSLEDYRGLVDFFSIGTNDLVQYMLGVDRANERVAHLFRPAHPAVLRTLAHILSTGARLGIPVSLCGETAGDPLFTPLLLGLGLRQFSVAAPKAPEIKRIVRLMPLEEAQSFARRTLKCTTSTDVMRRLSVLARRLQPEWRFDDAAQPAPPAEVAPVS